MEFRNRSSEPKHFGQKIDGRVGSIYEERLDKHGIAHLVKTGETNINDFIQASKEDTLIYNILDRFKNGDTNALMKTTGFFADITGMPTSLAEAHNLMVNIEKKFNELPLELKAAFDNSAAKFSKKLQDGSINEILNKFTKTENTEIIEKEMTE